MAEIAVKEIPDQLALTAKRRVSLATVAEGMHEAFGAIMAQAGASGAQFTGPPFCLYPGEMGDEFDMVVCLPVAPGAAQMRVYGRAIIDTSDAATAVKVQHMAQGILALGTTPRREGEAADDAALMAELAKGVSIEARAHRCEIISDHDPERFAAALTLMVRRAMESSRMRHDQAKAGRGDADAAERASAEEPPTVGNAPGKGTPR